jgi:hypothetical protein
MRLHAAFVCLAAVSVIPAAVGAQAGGMATPMAVDLRKATVGGWAEYAMTGGSARGTIRWSLVGRDKEKHILEMAMAGPSVGPTTITQMTLVPDPTSAANPLTRLVMKMGEAAPMEMPLDLPEMQGRRFAKPDPKKRVGKETIKVGAGSFATEHFREVVQQGTVDIWIDPRIIPLGLVKMTVTPTRPGAGQPSPVMVLELAAKGTGATPTITGKVKPFDPAALGMPAR